jgi:hypothetical protein
MERRAFAAALPLPIVVFWDLFLAVADGSGGSCLGFQGRPPLDGRRTLLCGRRLSSGIYTQTERRRQARNQDCAFHEIPPPYDFLEDDCADESSSGRAGFALRGPVASDSGQARSKAFIYRSIVFAQMSASRTHSLNGGTK